MFLTAVSLYLLEASLGMVSFHSTSLTIPSLSSNFVSVCVRVVSKGKTLVPEVFWFLVVVRVSNSRAWPGLSHGQGTSSQSCGRDLFDEDQEGPVVFTILDALLSSYSTMCWAFKLEQLPCLWSALGEDLLVSAWGTTSFLDASPRHARGPGISTNKSVRMKRRLPHLESGANLSAHLRQPLVHHPSFHDPSSLHPSNPPLTINPSHLHPVKYP